VVHHLRVPRRPQPTKLRILHGETRPSRIRADEPQPREAEPDPPEWLTPEARAVWDRTTVELRAMGLLAAADTDALVVYVNAVTNYAKAQQLIDRSGILIVAGRKDRGVVKNPANIVAEHNAVIVHRLAREFGLTPSARVNLASPRPAAEDDVLRLLS
jgi:P27 family predicted phage terminase small subunit